MYKRGENGVGVIFNPKNFITNLRKLMRFYDFLRKKRTLKPIDWSEINAIPNKTMQCHTIP